MTAAGTATGATEDVPLEMTTATLMPTTPHVDCYGILVIAAESHAEGKKKRKKCSERQAYY